MISYNCPCGFRETLNNSAGAQARCPKCGRLNRLRGLKESLNERCPRCAKTEPKFGPDDKREHFGNSRKKKETIEKFEERTSKCGICGRDESKED